MEKSVVLYDREGDVSVRYNKYSTQNGITKVKRKLAMEAVRYGISVH